VIGIIPKLLQVPMLIFLYFTAGAPVVEPVTGLAVGDTPAADFVSVMLRRDIGPKPEAPANERVTVVIALTSLGAVHTMLAVAPNTSLYIIVCDPTQGEAPLLGVPAN
jgi:hypothetical protein